MSELILIKLPDNPSYDQLLQRIYFLEDHLVRLKYQNEQYRKLLFGVKSEMILGESKLISDLIGSTDSKKIKEYFINYGLEVPFNRPNKLEFTNEVSIWI